MIVYNLVLLILFVNYSECNDYQQQQNHNYGVKGRTGHNIKSYGGYFHDTAGYNEAANNFVNTQNYYRPPIAPYQPYGWNFNQPARTYGGINTVSQTAASDQNPQSPSNNRIGWTNNNNYAGLNPNPFFPTLPQPNMFFPTFIPQFPFPQFPNVFPFQNNLPQPYPNYPTGPQVNTNNNQGPGSLPYPQNNLNPGFPTVNTNNAEQKPIHGFGRFPQTNVNQGIPEGNINRSPDLNNLGPNEVQTNLNQITTTERIQNKAGGPTTIKPTTSTIINNILAEGNSDEGVDYQFPLNPDFSKPTKAGGRTTTKPTTTTTINSIFGEDDSEETVDYQFTEKPNLPKNSSDVDIRTTGLNVRNNTSSDKDKGFASNSFFENNDQREWTDDDEQKWLATTKAPYFENKVPGLECTLPAAAVLGAKNAFKVSTLLPLDVPPGKPILSCNATDLLQSHVLLDGMTYGCNNNEITLSCLTHGGLIDECEGQTLQCDTDKLNVEKVWCTNGTLISSSDVECRNAFVEAHKSTLNCFFKHTRTSSIQTTARPSIVNVLPVVPLPTPDSSNIAGLDNRNENDFDYENIEQQSEEPQDLMPQVKNAMKNVFPQDLLTMPSTGYLPPQSSMQPLNPNLRSLINSVFNTDMLASSLTGNEDDQVRSVANRNHYDFSNVRDQKNSGNDGTKTRQTSTVNRFGGDNNQQQRPNLQDRLIFTD